MSIARVETPSAPSGVSISVFERCSARTRRDRSDLQSTTQEDSSDGCRRSAWHGQREGCRELPNASTKLPEEPTL
jgi:hypothetical protein